MTKAMKIKLIVSIVMLVSCVAIIATSTWAWYTLSSNEDVEMELHADGMVVLAFETTITVTPEDGVLAPAVETVTAIANNGTYPDVLTVGGNIAVAAQTVTFAPDLSVYLDNVDEGGTPVPQVLNYGISAIIVTKAANGRASERYEIPQERLYEVFGIEWKMQSEDMYSAEGGASTLTPETYVINPTTGTVATTEVTTNTIVHFTLKAWLAAPQGLMPPEFVGADVTFRLAINAEDRA